MKTFAVLTVLAAALSTGGCSSGREAADAPTKAGATASTTAPTTVATTTPTTTQQRDSYEVYLSLTTEQPIAKKDAVVRAALLCENREEWIPAEMNLSDFPTDEALMKAYCPDKAH